MVLRGLHTRHGKTAPKEESGLYFAFQGERSDGYTDPGRLDALRAFARGRAAFTGGWILDVLYAGYRARSRAADVLPESWIRQGRIGRFGSLDKSNRVDVDRHLAGLTLRGPAGGGWLRATGYCNFKDMRIFSNYTYYYFNEDLGDQIEQSDFRHYGGLHTTYTRVDPWEGVGELVSDWGIQWRMDAIRQTQANTVERVRFNLMNHYRIHEHNLGFYAQEKLLLSERWMLVGAVRYDLNLIDVNGTQDVRELDIYTNRVVVRQDVPRDAFAHAHAVSPKLSAVCSVSDRWKAFLNFGRGFVTRPARDQANRQEAFSYAVTGAELGTRWSDRGGKVGVSGGVWWMHKDRELVFDSEFGGTVFRGQSHRVGLEIEFRYAPFSWAYLATDLFFIHARLDSGSGWTVVPNTPSLLMTNVLAVQLEEGLHASLRGRLLGSREHDIKFDEEMAYTGCGPNGDAGVLAEGGEAHAEMTFHFDHVFGDIDEGPADPTDEEAVNFLAVGFGPFAELATGGSLDVDQVAMGQQMTGAVFQKLIDAVRTLGHSGEAHCHL